MILKIRFLHYLVFASGKSLKYVNSKWGQQDDPYKGDVVNSYNDGPVEDGS
jgi:hypothetical protein